MVSLVFDGGSTPAPHTTRRRQSLSLSQKLPEKLQILLDSVGSLRGKINF
jgi:hypothetical protein